jgi:hypothetical protein
MLKNDEKQYNPKQQQLLVFFDVDKEKLNWKKVNQSLNKSGIGLLGFFCCAHLYC